MIETLTDLPPLVQEAVRRLPRKGEPFPDTERVDWAKLMTVAFRWDYPEKPEPRPAAPPVQQLQVFTQAQGAAAKVVERVMANAKTNAGRARADDPLLDAADDPFIRRFALPLRSGGIVDRGKLLMIGEDPGVTVELPDAGALEPGTVITLEPLRTAPEPAAPLVAVYVCEHCGERFGNNRQARDVHEDRCAYGKPAEEATAPGYRCGQCGQVFDSKQALGGHVASFHDPDKTEHECRCGDTFTRKVQLLEHMRTCPTVTGGLTFACEHCGEEFATRHQRAGHKRWCKARPGAAERPAHRTEDGEPVPTSVVPPDVVPQRGWADQVDRVTRAARVEEAGGGGRSFLESLRWKPKTDPGDVSLGHKRRPEHEDLVRMASVDAAVIQFKV